MDNEQRPSLSQLDVMLQKYRKGERGMPTYEELATLLNAQPRVSCDPAENEAIARDAQAIVSAEVAALAADALKAAANWVSAEHASAHNVGAGGPGKIKEATEAGRKAEAEIKALATRACLSAAAPQVVADERALPPLPEMASAADLAHVMQTPEDWDENYRRTWQKLQVEAHNKRQWRKYALELRALLGGKHGS